MEVYMNDSGEYITIGEATKLTKKSVSTIRRFVLANKNAGSDIIKVDINDRNRPLYKINRSFLLTYFDITKKTFKKNENSSFERPKKHTKRVSEFYLYYKNAYVITKKLLIVAISFSIILIAVFLFIFFHYKQMFTDKYSNTSKHLQKEITVLNNIIELNDKRYKRALEANERLSNKVNNTQDKEIDEIFERINKIEGKVGYFKAPKDKHQIPNKSQITKNY